MSKLAVKLYQERVGKRKNVPSMDDYQPLIDAVFGEGKYDPSLGKNAKFQIEVEKSLMELDENGALGILQRYYVEECLLQGRSKEQIGKEIADNIDLLLADLETAAVRFLRRPEQAKELAKYIGK